MPPRSPDKITKNKQSVLTLSNCSLSIAAAADCVAVAAAVCSTAVAAGLRASVVSLFMHAWLLLRPSRAPCPSSSTYPAPRSVCGLHPFCGCCGAPPLYGCFGAQQGRCCCCYCCCCTRSPPLAYCRPLLLWCLALLLLLLLLL